MSIIPEPTARPDADELLLRMTDADELNAAGLTPRQAEIYLFLLSYTMRHGCPPTLREIGKRFGIASPNGVSGHLDALERKHRIRRGRNVSRGIWFPGVRWRPFREDSQPDGDAAPAAESEGLLIGA